MIAPVDDDRLAFLEVGAGDFDQTPVRRLGLGMQHHRFAVPHDVENRPLAQVEDGISRDLEHALAFVDDDRHANRLADREPPCRVVDQNADRQVARLRISHAADERDLSRHFFFLLGRGVGPWVAGIAAADGRGHPNVHGCRHAGRQPDRRENLSRIDNLSDRSTNRDRLAGVAVQAIEHAVDRREWCDNRDGPWKSRPAHRPS